MNVLMIGNKPNKCLLFKHLGWNVFMIINNNNNIKQRPIQELANYKCITTEVEPKGIVGKLKRAKEIKNWVKAFRIDLIFLNTKNDMLATKIAYFRKAKRPTTIATFCNPDAWTNNVKVRLLVPFLKCCLSGYLSMARFAYEKLVDYKFPKERLEYLQNYVDPSEFIQKKSYKFDNNHVSFIYSAVISKRKNQRFLLEVAIRLKKVNINPIFHLCGDFVDRKEELFIKQKITENQLEKNIILMGRIDNKKVRELIPNNDFYISSTSAEMSPNNILEAKASAMPIICSNVIGQADLIEQDKTGCLFEYDNVESCVNQILKLVKNESLRKQLGENAYLDVSQINSYKVGAAILSNFITNLDLKKNEKNSCN